MKERKASLQQKKAVLEGMCLFAESNHARLKMQNYSIKDPLPFKPGTGDKLLFKRLIEVAEPSIANECSMHWAYTANVLWGARVLEAPYYPQYGWYDQESLKEALKV